jgi:cyclic pyranopterin phosphate synthase
VTDELTHIGEDGNAHMVNVGEKPVTRRRAVAEAVVSLSPAVSEALFSGSLPKGDAMGAVRIAAIMAAKRTSDLVPLCHPLALDVVEVEVTPIDGGARVRVTCETTARTGVEMEAMTGAAIGAVTLYDMVKGLDRGAEIGPVRLLAKSGGRSGTGQR